ncbi:hypothetical protein AS156_14980 [Bradyrhizobium macuxiense]|uniref:Uncharacterized protein n=1 Tax=Bradyrhizobium macuxiense TaxID=1755647 RepID=A0A109JJ22_9BRAD|nr:hypothetical protein [Bradyrhizobium macuxiense]KWV49833.1 hypothetical protein AS156_14980 [Bradyrhizobium macuxiense]
MKLVKIAALVVAGTVSASAGEMSSDDIAKLPQDKVAAIKQYCANEWPDNYAMRVYCEDRQYGALKELIDRGSIEPKAKVSPDKPAAERTNDAAMAAVTYMTAQTKCDLSDEERNKLKKAMEDIIEGNGFTWDTLRANGATAVRGYLRDNPAWSKAMDDDQQAVVQVCRGVHTLIGKLRQ